MNDPLQELGLGAYPSASDYRDVKDYNVSLAVPYPVSFTDDLSDIAVTMQSKLGICTANLCYIVERLYEKKGIKVRLSRRFLYTVTKHYIDGNTTEGSSLRSALKAAYKYGIATEDSVPTNVNMSHADFIADFNFTPAIWAEAIKYRIGGYISIGIDKHSIAAAISQYGAVFARFEVGAEWFTSPMGIPSWQPKDILPLRPSKPVISGHGAVPFSYDASFPKMHMILRNSWSDQWGNKGNGDFFVDDYGPTEVWAITLEPITNNLPKEEDFNHVFNNDLQYGQTSDEVLQLQTFLMIQGYFDAKPTGFYGDITRQAVFQFQLDNVPNLTWLDRNLYKGKYCGSKTRAVINAMV